MLFDDNSIFAFYVLGAAAVVAASAADQSIDSYCPINCQCSGLTAVNCSSSSISNATFKHISFQVETLDLSKTSLKTIPESLIQYADIVTLNLSRNELSFIPGQTFARMRKLRILDLSSNKIRSLSQIEADTIFLTNLKLQSLNLAWNPLNDLVDEYNRVLYSESLTSLDVSHCSITHIQSELVLQHLPKLVKLNLSSNPLSRMPTLLSNSLQYLDVSSCNFQFLRADHFVDLGNLEELRCSFNAHLNDLMFRPVSRSIINLDASYCALGTNYASELTDVRRITLKGNQIKELVAYAFQNNSKLEILDLSENSIRSVNELAFYGAGSLRYVDLSHNAIVAMDESTFTFTPFLATLNLSRNSFETLNHLKGSTVQVLDMSRCELRTVRAQALLQMPSLQTLNVSYNSLEYLPENLTSYSLQSLDLSFCRITILNYFTFNRLPLLADINLDGNRLVYLKNNTFLALPKLASLSLQNNPWKCDCNDENFRKLSQSLESIPKLSQLLCMYPDNVTGMLWHEACSNVWNTSQRRAKDIIILGIIVMVLLISGMVACFVAIKEGLNVRTNRRREREFGIEGESGGGGGDYEIRESARKFTQLPSYDEALLLPKPPSSSSFDTATQNTPLIGRNEKIKKRQSATQTEETIEALLQEIEANEASKQSPHIARRSSLQEIEYINIRPPPPPPPLPLQCTEL